jgi:hypothetical protein
MNIKIDERFTLNQSSGDRFDLVEATERTSKKDGSTSEVEKALGYDMKIENCINMIIFERLKDKKDSRVTKIPANQFSLLR